MAQIEICFDGEGAFSTVDFRELPAILEREHAFVWIDVDAGKPDELKGLAREFGLHRVAVESALSRDTRAKITLFEDMLYLEFYGLREEEDEAVADDIGIFLGEKFLITVRRNDTPSLKPIQVRWKEEQTRSREKHHLLGQTSSTPHRKPTSAMLLYAVLDELVDGYFPVVEWFGRQVDQLEERVMEARAERPNLEIQHLRNRLLDLRRLLSPEQEVLNSLLRRDVPIIDEALIPYFAEVYDHILRIHDWMESYRDQLSTIVDLQLSMQSHRLDRTIRTLTNWSIILMSCSLVAGIYGMNFDHMPELGWRYGYVWALGLMVAFGAGIALILRARRWW